MLGPHHMHVMGPAVCQHSQGREIDDHVRRQTEGGADH